MCVIIKVNPRQSLPHRLLQNCYDMNPDGWGIMTAYENQIHYLKEVKDFNTFYESWKEFDPQYPRAIHFRRKTSGLINQANCHPFFPDNGDIGFMHNGIVKFTQKYENMNDTYHFLKDRIEPWVKDYVGITEDPKFYELLEEISGSSGSKFLFLTRAGNFHMTNKSAWVKNHGCMFSNSSVFTERTKKSTTTGASSYDSRFPRHGGYGHNSGDSWWHHGPNYSHVRSDHDLTTALTTSTGKPVTEVVDELDDRKALEGIIGSPLVIPQAKGTQTTTGYLGNIDRWEKMVAVAQTIMNEEQHQEEMDKIQHRIEEIMTNIGQYSCDSPICDALDDEFGELQAKLDALKKLDFKQMATAAADTFAAPGTKETETPIAEGTFEVVAEATTTLPLALPPPDVNAVGPVFPVAVSSPLTGEVLVGEVLPPEDNEEDMLAIFKTPEDIKAMPADDLFEWADEYPFAAAQCLLLFAGRV